MKKQVFTYWEDVTEAFTEKDGICHCCECRVEEYHISHSQRWDGWNYYKLRQKAHSKAEFRRLTGTFQRTLPVYFLNKEISSETGFGRVVSGSKWADYMRKRQADDENYELHLCSECIASGAATEKFGVKLNWVVNPSDECPAQGHDEVMYRTPGFSTKKDSWPVHCSEACVHVKKYPVGIDGVCHEFMCRQCGEVVTIMQ